MSINKFVWGLLAVTVILSMVLTACGGRATATAVIETSKEAVQLPPKATKEEVQSYPEAAQEAVQAYPEPAQEESQPYPELAQEETQPYPGPTEEETQPQPEPTKDVAQPQPTEAETPVEAGGHVEVFSWWIDGAEAAALNAIVKVFNQQYPSVEFSNAAASAGDETTARALLADRLQAGIPPDSWQGYAGQELISTYVAGNQLEALNFLFEQEGWLGVMPPTLVPYISQDGYIYSAPVNIQRTNLLWYNPGILAANGIQPPATLDEWFAAMDTLQAAGVLPLAMGEQWTAMHLFETILLASLGPVAYNGLWVGVTDWGSEEVKKALEDFQRALSYVNTDTASLSWQDASQLVVNGEAAFIVMGDWTEAYFRELGKEPNTDYGWTPVPGTFGNFQFLSDSFVLAVGAPNRDAAIAWLRVAGSKEGQDAFNSGKGSIPVRSDSDRELYGVYQQSAMDDWASNSIIGSLTGGVVANAAWKQEIDNGLGLFLVDGNVDNFLAALVTACQTAGPCQ